MVIPRANGPDVLLDKQWEDKIEVICVDTLDEVMEHAMVRSEEKKSLVQRLSEVIDRLAPDVTPSSRTT